MRFELQHLEVVDRNGLKLGHEHRTGMEVDQQQINELKSLGMSEQQPTKMVRTPEGGLLVSLRPLMDSGTFIGSIGVGKLIDSNALAETNFERKYPILALLNQSGEAASVSYTSTDPPTHFSIIPDN
ncbi:MAG: hypothetical protein OSB07_04340 [Dehalococcoidia bacterium]|nr:hypothetical protein [Dehalococcoidia bacterium]